MIKKIVLFLAIALGGASPSLAEINSLECYGIADRWVRQANILLLGLENRVNEKADQIVSLLNFDLGDSRFGVTGNAGLGRLKTPPFDCANPKAVLKSGMADIGLMPNYLVGARLFGIPVQVIDARLQGGQGTKSAIDPSARAKSGAKET